MNLEEKGNYHSVDRDGYTQCRHMQKEYGDNSLAELIKEDPWSNTCVRKGVITIVCTETATLNAGTCIRSRVITHLLDS